MKPLDLHLVHVGKCAGESVHSALNQHKIFPKEHHCGNSNADLADAILADDPTLFFIVLIRDPVARFVSAFEWDLWEKVLLPEAPPRNEQWRHIYETFQSANDLAEALTAKDAAVRMIADKAMRNSRLHMHMDLGWYLPPHVARRLTPANSFAVRTENIVGDFGRLIKELDAPAIPDFVLPLSKNDYKKKLPEERRPPLSELAISNIRDYSITSYETIRILKENGNIPT
ncbi:hypothetical protein ABMA46_20985 [Mesorhizobium sp. CN5-321]|uniref:hypothetical protein n=1 Tax=Mesorhizobium hunchu TaxID=3157708 RepID=UPI0032B829C8